LPRSIQYHPESHLHWVRRPRSLDQNGLPFDLALELTHRFFFRLPPNVRHPGRYRVLSTIRGRTTQARILTACDQPHELIVTFRGSTTANWEDNVLVNMTLFRFVHRTQGYAGNPRVHFGFQKMYQELQPSLRKAVAHWWGQGVARQVVFTGHSLGGALATLAAADLSDMLRPGQLSVIGFGSPRVGDQEFRRYVTPLIGNFYRQVESNDAIVHTPGTKLGYVHVGRELYYEKNQWTVCPLPEDPKCSRRWSKMQLVPHGWFRGKAFWDNAICMTDETFTKMRLKLRNAALTLGSKLITFPVTKLCQYFIKSTTECESNPVEVDWKNSLQK
jgi:hypothetical protein